MVSVVTSAAGGTLREVNGSAYMVASTTTLIPSPSHLPAGDSKACSCDTDIPLGIENSKTPSSLARCDPAIDPLAGSS